MALFEPIFSDYSPFPNPYSPMSLPAVGMAGFEPFFAGWF
jgi:hypothetical protein